MQFQAEHILLFNRLQVRYYGIIIVLAMLVAATVAARLAKRDKRDPDHVWGALTWAIIPGIILARAWFVLFPPASLCPDPADAATCQNVAWYLQHFFDLQNGAIAIWSGGLSIFGAVIGGGLGAWLYFSRYHNTVVHWINVILTPITFVFGLINKGINWVLARVGIKVSEAEPVEPFPDKGMSILPWLDIAGVALPLGQAIGRWANYINQELYGPPTDLPWGITIDIAHRVKPYTSPIDTPLETKFHPLFLYESLWNLIAFFVLLFIFQRYRRRLLKGDLFLIYLAQYSFIRFLLEFIRVEVAYLPGTTINSSQAITLLAFVVSLVVLTYRHRGGATPVKTKPEAAPAAPEAPAEESEPVSESVEQ